MSVSILGISKGKIALVLEPSPFTPLPAWRFHSMFHWKQTTLPSLTKHKRPGVLSILMIDLADSVVICQINLVLSVTSETLQTADP